MNENDDIYILITSKNGTRKIVQLFRIKSEPPARAKKGNQIKEFKWTSAKAVYKQIIFKLASFLKAKN